MVSQGKPVEGIDATGACSVGDQAAIKKLPGGDAEGSFPKTTEECARQALNIFKGIDETKFNTCLAGKVPGVSSGCSTCFRNAAQYGFKNCKIQCLGSWCSTGCLKCSAGYDTDGCTGFKGAQPTPCDRKEVVGVCSAGDQTAIKKLPGGD